MGSVVGGRNIAEAILLTQELIYCLNYGQSSDNLMMQLDLKVYDRSECNGLWFMLRKLDFVSTDGFSVSS